MTITPVFMSPAGTDPADDSPDWTPAEPEPELAEPVETGPDAAPGNPADSTPSAMARRHAHADLRGEATTEQALWLAEHPMLWMRALMALERATRLRIKEANQQVAGMIRPPDHQSRNLAAHKATCAQISRRQAGRTAYLRNIGDRLDDLITLFGANTICQLQLPGDVAAQFANMADLLTQGDHDQALKMAQRWAQDWAGETETPATPSSDEETSR